MKTVSATLAVDGWSDLTQTVTVAGASATNTVIVTPAPEYHLDYANSMVRCTAQGANSLTFTCEKVPENALVVNVLILE